MDVFEVGKEKFYQKTNKILMTCRFNSEKRQPDIGISGALKEGAQMSVHRWWVSPAYRRGSGFCE